MSSENHVCATCRLCDKAIFRDRRHARQVARRYPGAGHQRAYRCPLGHWHLGVLESVA